MQTYGMPQGRCQFGVVTGDITPPVGIYSRMWGAAAHDRAESVHRPALATAVAFGPVDGDGIAGAHLIVALDMCVLGRDELQPMLAAIEQQSGIGDVSVVCSHTHGVGLMGPDRHDKPGGDLIAPHVERITAVVGELAQSAREAMQPVTVCYAAGHCDLARTRDYFDQDAGEHVCGFDPTGSPDDTVMVAKVHGDGGEVVATVVNYACHPTTLAWDSRALSPDYVGAMRETVQARYPAPCLFLQGASGDLGPRDGFVGDPAVADRNGHWLGYAALTALESTLPPQHELSYAGGVASGTTIGVWKTSELPTDRQRKVAAFGGRRWTFDAPYRDGMPSRAEAEAALARSLDDEGRAGSDEERHERRAMVERATRLLSRVAALPDGARFPLQLHAWTVGEAVWLVVQGEPYHWLQTELRRRLAPRPLLLSTIAADWGASYLPPENLYDKGIYQESIAVLAPGTLEALVDHVSQQLAALA